jgi:flagellar assembly protein FliH
MSDLGFRIPAPGVNLFEALARPSGFRADSRYEAPALVDQAPAPEPQPHDEPDAPDPIDEAFAQGFAAGHEQARSEAEARAEADAAAREGLGLSLTRLDATLAEELRMRLRDTVAALCESAIAPLALDEEAMLRRIDVAISMLSRADDDRVIRLHPDDLKLIAPRLSSEWQIDADARLERGTIRIETINGGIEDGPATWRLAIAEALQQC